MPIYVVLLKGKFWVWVVGGKLSSPLALNIKPLVLRFALRVRSEEHGVRERERYWHEEYQARCQVSDFKVPLRGYAAGADKDNPKVSWQFWKEITFVSERTFLTGRINNLNHALISLSINKLSLRNVVYGVITWSCSLCCCTCAIILCRACPQNELEDMINLVPESWHIVGKDLFPAYRVMLWVRACCGLLLLFENST